MKSGMLQVLEQLVVDDEEKGYVEYFLDTQHKYCKAEAFFICKCFKYFQVYAHRCKPGQIGAYCWDRVKIFGDQPTTPRSRQVKFNVINVIYSQRRRGERKRLLEVSLQRSTKNLEKPIFFMRLVSSTR